MQIRQQVPSLASVFGAVEIAVAVGRLRVPGRYIDVPGVQWIDHDVVQHHLSRTAQMSQTRPTGAVVSRKVNRARAGAEKNAVGILGVESQTADTAAVWPKRLPLLGRRQSGGKGKQQEQNATDANPRMHGQYDHTLPNPNGSRLTRWF